MNYNSLVFLLAMLAIVPATAQQEEATPRQITSFEKGVIGSLAGVAEVMMTGAFLRNVMVQMQTQDPSCKKGFVAVMRIVLKNPWIGAKPDLMSLAPTTAMQMGLKSWLSNYCNSDTLNSAVAGAASAVLCAPAETVATRQSVTKTRFVPTVKELAQRKKLYAGAQAVLLREAVWSVALQSWYKWFALVVEEKTGWENKMAVTAVAGVPVGAVAAVLSHPFATVGTIMQNNVERSESMYIVGKKLVAKEGVRALMKGAVPRALRAAIALPVMVGSSAWMEQALIGRKPNEPKAGGSMRAQKLSEEPMSHADAAIDKAMEQCVLEQERMIGEHTRALMEPSIMGAADSDYMKKPYISVGDMFAEVFRRPKTTRPYEFVATQCSALRNYVLDFFGGLFDRF